MGYSAYFHDPINRSLLGTGTNKKVPSSFYWMGNLSLGSGTWDKGFNPLLTIGYGFSSNTVTRAFTVDMKTIDTPAMHRNAL